MERGHLTRQMLRARHAMRVFLALDIAVLGATVGWVSLGVDLIVGLVWGLVGCGWLITDVGCWDLEAPALKLRRILAYAGVALVLARTVLPPHWVASDFIESPGPWLFVAQGVLAVPAIVLTTTALSALAHAPPKLPTSAHVPVEGPAEIWPVLLVNQPRRRHP